MTAAPGEPLFTAIREIGVVHPGDTLMLSTEQHLDAKQADRIKRVVEDEMPDVHVIIVTGLTATVQRNAE